MTQHLVELIARYGLTIVVASVLLDQIGLPFPAMPMLIVAGALAVQGTLAATPLLVFCVLACLLADSLWFELGERYGLKVLRTLCRISLEPDSCVSQTQLRFDRWGSNSILVAKFVPGLAVIAPPMAGAMRIGWRRFLALSTVAATLWVGAGLLAGAVFHRQVTAALAALDRVGNLALVLLLGLAALYVAYKAVERARFRHLLRMARISVEELYELVQAGAEPVIVDVRSDAARTLEPHWIPGALHVPLHDIGTHVAALSRDDEIVLYCNCPNEASAARVARILRAHGFRRVRPLAGGLDAWIAAGYDVDTADGVRRAAAPTPRAPAPRRQLPRRSP